MSAFLFVIGDQQLKQDTTQQLEEFLVKCKKIVDNFNWKKYQPCTFNSDRAAGYRTSISKIQAELEFRRTGVVNNEVYLVPGYNPPSDNQPACIVIPNKSENKNEKDSY